MAIVKRKRIPDKEAPHQAVFLLKAEIMERQPDGKVTGRPIEILSDVLTVTAKTFEECKIKTLQLFERLQNNGTENK